MMSFQSIRVLRFAMAREDTSAAYLIYPFCARLSIEALAALKLVSEAIRLELFKIGSTVPPLEQTPESAEARSSPVDPQIRQMSAPDALQLAMRKQKDSFRMFAELMVHTDNPEAAEILYNLAEVEMRHLLKLEKEYNALTPHRRNP